MKAIKCSTKIIVPTDYVKKDVIDRYKINKDKISTIYEGVMELDLKEDKKIKVESVLLKYNVKNPYFIYVGNVYPHKNIDRVVDAIVSLNKQYTKKVDFLIICSRSIFSEKLNTMIKNKNAQSNVRFLGFVDDYEMSILLKNSIAFIYPSLEEGFGLQGLEAIQSETLLLASDIPVFREIYTHNAIYFNPLEVLSIKSVMKDVMKMNKTERTNMIEKGKGFIKIYSWKKMARGTLDVYKNAAS